MKHVPVAAFKDRVSEYVAEAERGEEVIITRHGKPAARLIAALGDEDRKAVAKEAFARLRELRESFRAAGVTATTDEIISWKNEGRR